MEYTNTAACLYKPLATSVPSHPLKTLVQSSYHINSSRSSSSLYHYQHTSMAMASKYQCFFSVGFFILAIWTYQGLGRKLHDETSLSEMHEQWMVEHGRVYKHAAEKEQRFKIFKDNVEFIENFNNAGDRPYKLSINEFADQTNEEFRASHNGYRRPNHASVKPTLFMYQNVTQVPPTKDWRKEGAVTDVKNQKNCGECNTIIR